MMPLLRNISKENVIPIIDFEDLTQVDLNYLLLHVYDCLPTVGLRFSETVAIRLPSDQSMEVTFVDTLEDVSKVTVEDIKKALRHKSKRGTIREMGE